MVREGTIWFTITDIVSVRRVLREAFAQNLELLDELASS